MSFPEVESLLPHRATLLRLDALTSWSEEQVEGRFEVKEGDPFVRDGLLREEALIETLAQTVAAGQGYIGYKDGLEPSLGFLTGVEDFSYLATIPQGATIATKATLDAAKGPMRIMLCEAHVDGQIVAKGLLKFFLQENKQA
ncbi:MAG TPA: hypothetical protein DCE42_08910 [Myxococcales bacterium]|nr:hypothetical protein [Deltaproteobacteria bacterium]HAA54866.1 hypothetical protein [Myxococcales bacterium]|tara:strand:- start:116 stop:541 length:426 start_codon:yes stop_codon:yes gene_type:complete